MKSPVTLIAASLAVALAAVSGLPADAATLIQDHYTRSGPSETVIAPFTSAATGTANAYAGVVELVVSGTGASLFASLNDAFYGVPGGSPYDSQYYQLNIGWTSAPLSPLVGEPRNIDNFIVFIDGVGAVMPGSKPAYSTTHTYHFVVDTGLVAVEALQFGVSDGVFSDNSGAYTIEVYQLVSGTSVPEPATVLVLAAALLALGGAGMVRSSAVRRRQAPAQA